MSNKKIVWGISAIVLVAAILIVSEKLTSISPPEHRTRFFPGIEERHVTAIVIKEGGEAIRLEKGCVWKVAKVSASDARNSITCAGTADADGKNAAKQVGMNFKDFVDKNATDSAGANAADDDASVQAQSGEPEIQPADTTLVQIAVERIVSLKKGDLISSNAEKQGTFGVDSASVSSIEIYTNGKSDPAGVLIIGKNGPDWSSNYVRLNGSNDVYLISGALRQALFFDIERWRKKPDPEPEPAPEPEPVDSGV